MKKLALTTLVLSILACKGSPPPKHPPIISDTIKKDYFKTKSLYDQALPQFQRIQDEYQKAQQKILAICGSDYTPQLDSSGEPFCQEKVKSTSPATTNKPATKK